MGPVNRPLDLEWLEDFLLLAESGNFSRAAQARGIAQPAFSRHIKALEEWAGAELVDRTQHPAVPTAAGEVMVAAAKEVVGRLSQARTRAHEAREQAGRSLRFAATHVLSLTFFPVWLQQVEQRLPPDEGLGAIHMVSDSFQACEDLMLQRRAQFLLGYGHTAVKTRLLAPEFESVQVGEDQLVPVCAPDGKGRPRYSLDGTGGSVQPLLAYSLESGLGQIMRAQLPQVFDAAHFKPALTSHHAALLKTMALEGRGIAWLPASLVNAELLAGRVVPAGSGANWTVPMEIRLTRAAGDMPPAAAAVWAASQVRTSLVR